MLKTRLIPCLDVKDGRVVKGVNFVDLVDAGDPVEAAKAYDAAGLMSFVSLILQLLLIIARPCMMWSSAQLNVVLCRLRLAAG